MTDDGFGYAMLVEAFRADVKREMKKMTDAESLVEMQSGPESTRVPRAFTAKRCSDCGKEYAPRSSRSKRCGNCRARWEREMEHGAPAVAPVDTADSVDAADDADEDYTPPHSEPGVVRRLTEREAIRKMLSARRHALEAELREIDLIERRVW